MRIFSSSVRGGREGSLLGCVDRTVTAPGGRLLAERLARPLTDVAALKRRLDAVGFFLSDAARRNGARKELRMAGDLTRSLTRLILGRGGPRDLAHLRDALMAGDRAAARILGLGADAPADVVEACSALSLAAHPASASLAQTLERALAAELPLLTRDGGFIASGFDAALDDARALRDDSRKVIAALQAKYAEETGIAGLKLKHNNVLGYHIDATTKQAEALMAPPLNVRFIHRQTNAGTAFGPRLSLRGMKLLPPAVGAEAASGAAPGPATAPEVAIESAALDINPLNLLLPGGSLYSFRVIGAHFELVRSANGQFRVSGFGVSRKGYAAQGSVLKTLARLGEVVLEESRLDYLDEHEGVRFGFRDISGRMQFENDELSSEIQAACTMSAADWCSARSRPLCCCPWAPTSSSTTT